MEALMRHAFEILESHNQSERVRNRESERDRKLNEISFVKSAAGIIYFDYMCVPFCLSPTLTFLDILQRQGTTKQRAFAAMLIEAIKNHPRKTPLSVILC